MKEITAALMGARRIALVSHRDPDPDTIGSALALGLGLESLGKRVSWHCADPVPEQQRFLHGSERFTQEPPSEDVDLVVTVDFGSVDRAKFHSGATHAREHRSPRVERPLRAANLVDATSWRARSWSRALSTRSESSGLRRWRRPRSRHHDGHGLVPVPQHRRAGARPGGSASRGRRRPAGDHVQHLSEQAFRGAEALGFAFSRLTREAASARWTEIRAGDIAAAQARDEDTQVSSSRSRVERNARRASLQRQAGPYPSGALPLQLRFRPTSQWEPSVDASALMARFGEAATSARPAL